MQNDKGFEKMRPESPPARVQAAVLPGVAPAATGQAGRKVSSRDTLYMAVSLRCARRNRGTGGPQDAMQMLSALAVESHPSGPSSGTPVRWTTGAGGICLSEPPGPWRASRALCLVRTRGSVGSGTGGEAPPLGH